MQTDRQTASQQGPSLGSLKLEALSRIAVRRPRRQQSSMDSSSWKSYLPSKPEWSHSRIIGLHHAFQRCINALEIILTHCHWYLLRTLQLTIVRCRYDRSYDLAFVQRRFAGKRFIALNILWHYKEQASFPVCICNQIILLGLWDIWQALCQHLISCSQQSTPDVFKECSSLDHWLDIMIKLLHELAAMQCIHHSLLIFSGQHSRLLAGIPIQCR